MQRQSLRLVDQAVNNDRVARRIFAYGYLQFTRGIRTALKAAIIPLLLFVLLPVLLLDSNLFRSRVDERHYVKGNP